MKNTIQKLMTSQQIYSISSIDDLGVIVSLISPHLADSFFLPWLMKTYKHIEWCRIDVIGPQLNVYNWIHLLTDYRRDDASEFFVVAFHAIDGDVEDMWEPYLWQRWLRPKPCLGPEEVLPTSASISTLTMLC